MPTNNNNSKNYYKSFDVEGVAKVPFKEPQEIRPKYLTVDRRKILEDIKRKEAIKEKKLRLSSILVQKLCKKHGKENYTVISNVVNDFIKNREKVNADDLDLLEKETRNAIKTRNNQLRSNYNNNNNKSNNQNESNYQNNNSNQVKLPPPPPGSEWKILQTYESIIGEEEKQKEIEINRKKKLDFKNNLDEHIKLLHNNKNYDKIDDIKYNNYVNQDIINYYEEEKQKNEINKRKHLEELYIRQQQVKEIEDKKRYELELEKLENEKLIQYNQNLIENEKNELKMKKIIEKKRLNDIMNENSINLLNKKVIKKLDTENDIKLMKEYELKLDKEEKERNENFQKRLQILDSFSKRYESIGPGKINSISELNNDMRILNDLKLKNDNDIRNEQLKNELRKKQLFDIKSENLKIIENKNLLKNQIKLEDDIYNHQYQNDVSNYQLNVKSNKINQLRNKLSYKQLLDEQIKQKQRNQLILDGMVDIEKKINQPLIDKIVNDTNVYSKVLDKIGLRSSITR